jgi:hypothetical protein
MIAATSIKQKHSALLIGFGILIASLLFNSCSFSTNTNHNQRHIAYDTNPQHVLIRTFYGGGLYGYFSPAPGISIYGDGTYVEGTDRQGNLSGEALQQLLGTLVDTYGLFKLSQTRFEDIQDQNETFLEVAFNNSKEELVYGPFGNMQGESPEALDAYKRLGNALKAIDKATQGPAHPYEGTRFALLVRQNVQSDALQATQSWTLKDFTLAQVAAYECGIVPNRQIVHDYERPCLKYVIPQHAILLTPAQVEALKPQLSEGERVFSEQGLFYHVILRPLLPDELPTKSLAMFGGMQGEYRSVPLLVGPIPPLPTATPVS